MTRTHHTPAGSLHAVTLPPVPGVSIDTDRSATAPRLPIICRARRWGHGSPAKASHAPIINARIAAIREALGAEE